MFDATIDDVENHRASKYVVTSDGSPVTRLEVLKLWSEDAAFRTFFTNLLAASPFSGYRWETPMLSRRTATRPFEFVLLYTPEFFQRRTDAKTFQTFFTVDDADQGIVTFSNVGGDATLVVPSPRTDNDAYGHLAAFVRRAPHPQQDSFWRVIGTTIQRQLSDRGMWLSTAGGGVAWLHVRLDSRPKYYGYSPYKQTEAQATI